MTGINKPERLDEERRKLEKFKEEIVSNVSHDLKTPITIILSAIELAMAEKSSHEMRRLLRMVKKATDRQKILVENLVTSISLKHAQSAHDFGARDNRSSRRKNRPREQTRKRK